MEPQQNVPLQGAAYPTKYRRNHPRSKNGCLTCRGKRKKCDETKPNCNACVRSAQSCVWPPDSSQKQESQNGPAASSHAASTAELRWQIEQRAEKFGAGREKTKSAVMEPGLAMFTPLNIQIFKRFFFDWATSADVTAGYTMSWFASLPQIYAKTTVDSVTHKSINALANASYGQRFNSSQALRNATRWYGEAIHMLKDKMLCIVDSAQYCDVMDSIVLLGIYESLMDESIALEGSWVSHTSGASILLSIRGQEKILKSAPEFQVSVISFLQMIYSGMLTGQAPPMSWESVHLLALPKVPHFYTHIELMYQSTCLCAEWRTALLADEGDENFERLAEIATRALLLDKKLAEWTQSVPPSVRYTVESISIESQPGWSLPLLTGTWTPSNSHVYPSLMIKILWRFCWMIRVILNQVLLFTHDILEKRDATTNPLTSHKAEIETNISSNIDLICESCVSTFVNIGKKDPENSRAQDVPSLLGYLTLHVLPTMGLCLEQVKLRLSNCDLSGRRDWVARMRHFLRVNFGIAKGATAIPPSSIGKLPILIWGLPQKLPSGK
ncbi:hypothetical protein F53441_11919 [Fusarium austroafricanum]|uniref:Zn(2)-C6 fungal-type domain-containing protein n=1 Tax=Fusarium austroafricanum TaxID=2364996 RepID=A0A8H4K3F5_9HYPO|nr:hypothetical protein F53441_11919 [Fusarium austroafricanum]